MSYIATLLLTLFFAPYSTCALQKSFSAERVFSPHLSDAWYPQNSKKLTSLLKQLTTAAEKHFAMTADGKKIRALIVPHAGYRYSGTVAAAAYRLVDPSSITTIIILAPSHYGTFSGIALPHFATYRIPTDDLQLAEDTITTLHANKLFHEQPDAFRPEHSLEIQLPLIRFFFPSARIVPLIAGQLTHQEVTVVAHALKQVVTPTTLVVVSTDLTHYGPQFHYTPFTDHIPLRIRQLDSRVLDAIQQSSRANFQRIITETHDTVCGKVPLEILLSMIEQTAFGATQTRLVAYATSSAITHDDENSVSYGSLIVTQERNNVSINQLEKNMLLTYARDILRNSFTADIDEKLLLPLMTPVIQQPQAVFVTLYKQTKKGAAPELRGCIGTTHANQPFFVNVADKTRAAAFQDTRFLPVTEDELSSISLEISALQPPHAVASYRDIVLHKDGIILTVGARSALFLPQVATEFGFTLEETLNQLSKKAGLAADAWKKPEARFQVFTSMDFGPVFV
jgi:AmmeMemoRadiSam system protein B/AmmeMemoRadiSam system protein A